MLDKVLEDIQAIRNLKATNNITKEAKVKYKTTPSLESIYTSQLKITEENLLTDEKEYLTSNYKSKYMDITYYYEGMKEDTSKKEEEIKKLEDSIRRRENLLSNENYVKKAPANIVEMDRKKLLEEKERLEILKSI